MRSVKLAAVSSGNRVLSMSARSDCIGRATSKTVAIRDVARPANPATAVYTNRVGGSFAKRRPNQVPSGPNLEGQVMDVDVRSRIRSGMLALVLVASCG